MALVCVLMQGRGNERKSVHFMCAVRLSLQDTSKRIDDGQPRWRKMTVIGREIAWLMVLLNCWPVLTESAPARLALVIGNAAYKNETPLSNTLNDARDMADKLRQLDFEVTKVEDVGRRELGRVVNAFIRRLRGTDATVLFYYSGHGMQVHGQNYLLPVDVEIKDELDVPLEGLALNRLLGGIGERGENAVNLVILDTCRNNPFRQRGNKAIGDKGLARVKAPGGTLILYATRPGETASDNPSGRNGLFTKHLLSALDAPGTPVEKAFKLVARNVYRDSGKAQSPWQEGLILGDFYFLPIGYLRIGVDVVDAWVSVNGRPAGLASAGRPLNLTRGLPVGVVEIQVEAQGKTQRRRTQIEPGQWTQARFSFADALEPLPQPPPTPTPVPDHQQAFEPPMIAIKGDCFQMGSPSGFFKKEEGRHDNERQHKVCVEDFQMGKYEVTQAQWQAVMGNNPSYFKGCDDCPVENVSWNEVQKYIEKLNRRSNKRYCFPTEAEWEFAARAGTTGPFSFWGKISAQKVNYNAHYTYAGSAKGASRQKTVPVGSLPANPWGLHEVHGNVWEWTCSQYKKDYDGSEKTCIGKNDADAERSLRGGSWDNKPRSVRSAYRFRDRPTNRSYYGGFRLARTL